MVGQKMARLLVLALWFEVGRAQIELKCPSGFVIYGEKTYTRHVDQTLYCLECRTNSAFFTILEVCHDFGYLSSLSFVVIPSSEWNKALPGNTTIAGFTCESGQDDLPIECHHEKTYSSVQLRWVENSAEINRTFIQSPMKGEDMVAPALDSNRLYCPRNGRAQGIFAFIIKTWTNYSRAQVCLKCSSVLICSNMGYFTRLNISTQASVPTRDIVYGQCFEASCLDEIPFNPDWTNRSAPYGFTFPKTPMTYSDATLLESIVFLNCSIPENGSNPMDLAQIQMGVYTLAGTLAIVALMIVLLTIYKRGSKTRPHSRGWSILSRTNCQTAQAQDGHHVRIIKMQTLSRDSLVSSANSRDAYEYDYQYYVHANKPEYAYAQIAT